MTPLEYKGYQATVEYEEGRLVIHVLHVRDHLVAECMDAAKVEEEFHALVDEYIEDCAAIGKEPDKPFKGVFNVRISPELHRESVKAATAEGRTLNDFVASALDLAVSRSRPMHIVGAGWMKLTYAVAAERFSPIPPVPVHASFLPAGPMAGSVEAWTKAEIKERRH
jgi:predicted HicB family RNase H-like nuclease